MLILYVDSTGLRVLCPTHLIVSEDGEEELTAEDGTNPAQSGESDEGTVENPPSEASYLEYSRSELTEILEQTDEEILRATLEETRPTLDTIEGFLSDIDDKAGQTLRLNTILIGLLLTVISLAFSQNLPGVTQFLNLAFYFGLGASGLSIVAALLTYTVCRKF